MDLYAVLLHSSSVLDKQWLNQHLDNNLPYWTFGALFPLSPSYDYSSFYRIACAKCGRPWSELFCASCRSTVYCSSACRRLHEEEHEAACPGADSYLAIHADTDQQESTTLTFIAALPCSSSVLLLGEDTPPVHSALDLLPLKDGTTLMIKIQIPLVGDGPLLLSDRDGLILRLVHCSESPVGGNCKQEEEVEDVCLGGGSTR